MKVTYSLKSGSLVIALFVLASLSLPSAAFGQMRVFATSIAYDGDLGGLVGADGICKTLASNAGLPGTYKAWLSDSSRAPSTRFIQSSGPYVLVDGTVIANNWADLVDGTLANPINLDENGSTVNNFAWTGTSADGTANPPNCSDWSSNSVAGFGIYGFTAATDSNWSFLNQASCNDLLRLYCFQQPTVSVPTMNEWGMIIFMVLAGLGSVYYLGRNRRNQS